MKNKKVERVIDEILCSFPINKDARMIKGYIKELEEELETRIDEIDTYIEVVEQLQKELEMKDKALDKACEELEMYSIAFNEEYYHDVKNRYEWKAWCLKGE